LELGVTDLSMAHSLVPGAVVALVGCGAGALFSRRAESQVLEAPVDSDCEIRSVAVIVPARNESRLIGGCLRSLLQQDRVQEVIVANDASTDGTVAAALDASGRDSRVRVVHAAAAGRLAAIRAGLARASAPYAAVVDADHELRTGTISAALSKIEHEGVDLISIVPCAAHLTRWDRLVSPLIVNNAAALGVALPFLNSDKSRFGILTGALLLARTSLLRDLAGGPGSAFAGEAVFLDDPVIARRAKEKGLRLCLLRCLEVQETRGFRSLSAAIGILSRWMGGILHDPGMRGPFGLSTFSLLGLVLLALTGVPGIVAGSVLSSPSREAVLSATAGLWISFVLQHARGLAHAGVSRAYALLSPIGVGIIAAAWWWALIRHVMGVPLRWKGRPLATRVSPS
jgi:hypothetical protein